VNVVNFLRERPLWPITALVELGRDWLGRFVAIQGVDRSMALAAQAYSAFLPLLIVYASLLPRTDNQNFADVLVTRFELSGATATSVRQAFAPADDVESSVTALGLLLLLISALSFTRGMQRLYEGTFGLPTLGMRNTLRGLQWLAIVTLVFGLRPIVTSPFDGVVLVVLTLAISTFVWLITPALLLGRRLGWRRLLPSALLTAIGMAGVGVWSVIWMPHTLATSAKQFGVIGIAFAMLAWFVAVAFVVTIATTGGAMIADRLARRFGRVEATA
jgi:membrane protein